ncbi:hypothetical protein Vafri_20778, partial [Volvox africanus]
MPVKKPFSSYCSPRLGLIVSLLGTSCRQITATTNPTTTARSASAPGGCGSAAAEGGSPLEPSPLDERLLDEQEVLRLNLAALQRREELLQVAAKEWGKARAIMTGVRVSRKQAGPLQAILFSDTLARIRAFQKAQQRHHSPSDVGQQQPYMVSDRDQYTWPPPRPTGPNPERSPQLPPADPTAVQRHKSDAAAAIGAGPG